MWCVVWRGVMWWVCSVSEVGLCYTYLSGVLSGVKFLGGNLHIYLYVCMYIHTCMARGGVAWRKRDVVYSMILKTHTHACSMHISFSFRIMMKMRQWQSIVMYVTAGRYACGMIVV